MGTAAQGGSQDVDAAVAAARRAFPAWRDTAPRARGRILAKIADRLEQETERIARILSLENGNAIRTQSRGELAFAVDAFRYFGGLASEVKGEQIPLSIDKLDYSRREPYGVVAAIIPWNAPVQLGTMKIAPAIVAGNTLVLKTAEDAPFAILEIAKICQEFLPPGVLNVVHGVGTVTGEALITNPDVDKLSFTGSTAAASSPLQLRASFRCRLSSAARIRKSSSPTPTTIGPWTPPSWACASSARDSPAPPDPGCSYTSRSSTRSCRSSPPRSPG